MKPRKGMWILLAALAIFFAHGAAVADESCQYCGMKKSMYGHSWVVITHEDGTTCGLCSVHCAAIDMALHVGKPIASVTVGDYNTKEQIDAEKAYWVIGGDQMGVMTARAKWAFKTKEAADKFMKEHGGRPATYGEVIKASFEDMYEDTLMIQKKHKMRQGQESH
jgi:copper chaperone NosL